MKTTDRIKALQWWDTLRATDISKGDRGYYTNKYFGGRMYRYLTDIEIEEIWRKEKTNS